MRWMTRLILFTACALTAHGVCAQDADYADKSLWLCHPQAPNLCAQDLSTTVVAADGGTYVEAFEALQNASFDCFYVYPTVSSDESGNSDLRPNQAEAGVIQVQFARFGSVCRTFAPIYRQVTLTALRAGLAGEQMSIDRDLGYHDVKRAWQHYLKHDNQGRGVILIGHSQGSGVLTRLLIEEIDGRKIQERLIAAYLIGSAAVLVPPGKDVGGTFQHLPLCRAEDQTQCVVSFASFRDTLPPPADARFGQARNPDQRQWLTACNLPGALAGGAAPLAAYLSAVGNNLASSSTQPAWTTPPTDIQTPFVQVPGLLQGECVTHDGFSYLSVHVNGNPEDPRADDISGDVVIGDQIAKDWGLHLIDMHLTLGNLVALAKRQGAAYGARH